MGVNITTIIYLRVLIIQIGSTIISMVVEAQGNWCLKQPNSKKQVPMAILWDLFGMVKRPFQWLSDLQLGDKKVTLNQLAHENWIQFSNKHFRDFKRRTTKHLSDALITHQKSPFLGPRISRISPDFVPRAVAQSLDDFWPPANLASRAAS